MIKNLIESLDKLSESPNQLKAKERVGKSKHSHSGEQKNVTRGKLVGEEEEVNEMEVSDRAVTDAMGYFEDFAEEAMQKNRAQVYDMKSGSIDEEDYAAMRHDLIGDVVGHIQDGLERQSMGFFSLEEVRDWAENWVDNYLENEAMPEEQENNRRSRLRETYEKYKPEPINESKDDELDRLRWLSGRKDR